MKRLTFILLVTAMLLCCEECKPPLENTPPVIKSIIADHDSVFPGDTVKLSCDYYDAEGDSIYVQWTSLSGKFVMDSMSRIERWIAPKIPGNYFIELRISDKANSMVIVDSIDVLVVDRPGTFTDLRDGHTYKCVKIGQQIWMAENLAYHPWVGYTFPDSSGYFIYGYGDNSHVAPEQISYYKEYGILYGHESALKDCPPGWHLSTDEDWKTLEIFLGMDPAEAADSRRESITAKNVALSLMSDNLWCGNNSSGFNAVPGGTINRYYSWAGHDWFWEFNGPGSLALYLSPFYSPNYNENLCRAINGSESDGILHVGFNIWRIDDNEGFSVRCVKNSSTGSF